MRRRNADTRDPEDARTETVRRFNRFYTQKIGVLQERLLHSPFSLQEARVLYELQHQNAITAKGLAQELDLDPGYLSRILRRLEGAGLVVRTPSEEDRRQALLALTAGGRKAFRSLDAASRTEIRSLLASLPPEDQVRLVAAMQTIEEVWAPPAEQRVPYILRGPMAGDFGFVIHRHGAIYSREYHWNEEFEALVAEIVAAFIRNFDPKRERCWIAERNGEFAGCVFLVRDPEDGQTARLRLLLTEPRARGLGIGRRLVQECTRFSRQCGYARIVLWTNDVLASARRIYEAEGYRLVREEKHHSFGHDLTGQFWELTL